MSKLPQAFQGLEKDTCPDVASRRLQQEKPDNDDQELTFNPDLKRFMDKAPLSMRKLTPEQVESILTQFKARFDEMPHLHEGCDWERVETALRSNHEALRSIEEMARMGHEPNVYNFDDEGCDIGTCSLEEPMSTRDFVYNHQAARILLEEDPDDTFQGTAVEAAEEMGLELIPPEKYKNVLQAKGIFDKDSYGWLGLDDDTPSMQAPFGLRAVAEVHCFAHPITCHDEKWGWRGTLRVPWK
ncbi:hypothetical protein CVV38_02795 [Candidatus Peregrinibacteria bacterium HGW-Peregrinibacteria-1]|jgi:hypothetical protein|nr:MAG: hypothetical protein CVV38_02795 [Candidatus Peregrinibacteria bacterium HGW-Peregrinibacteria-1]